MVHKDKITRIRVVQSYTGMVTLGCTPLTAFACFQAVYSKRDGWWLGHRREIQVAETRLLHYSGAAAFELAAELATSPSQRSQDERINLLNAPQPILAFWYYRFFLFPA